MGQIKTYSQFLNEASRPWDDILTTKDKIDDFIKKWNYLKGASYTINDDLTVDVDGDVDISYSKNPLIILRFGKVTGSFWCYNSKLRTLEGCPTYVGGNFNCSENNIKSLKHCPTYVGGNFNCDYNLITSLKGCPEEIGGDFKCSINKLKTLEYAPKIREDFWCQYNNIKTFVYLDKNFIKIEYQKDKRVNAIYNDTVTYPTWEHCHAESLRLWLSEEPKECLPFIKRLKSNDPEEYENIISKSRELRFALGLEEEEITKVYNQVKDVEKGYF